VKKIYYDKWLRTQEATLSNKNFIELFTAYERGNDVRAKNEK
jgi:hypothetical protein